MAKARIIRLPADTDLAHLDAVQVLALKLMEAHELEGWSFRWDGALRQAGICDHRNREIRLSARLMAIWPIEDCRDIILHEIAHAIAGSRAGHGLQWRAVCRKIGARPERNYDSNQPSIPSKYIGTCPNGHEIERDRLTKAARGGSCDRCSNRYDARFRFTWKEREDR